jgi:hypothetical protein
MTWRGALTQVVERYGTQWPIPDTWSESAPGVFSGPEGLLKLTTDEGELIDPARCRAGEASRPVGWHLAETRNGVAIAARYVEQGARVLVWSVRVDADDIDDPSLALPEVQATYVLVANVERATRVVDEFLQYRRLAETGELDAFGHAALGPVPVLGAWSPDSEVAGNKELLSRRSDVELMYIGGGYLSFSDERSCCGIGLAPLPWRRISISRLGAMLRLAAGDSRVLTVLSTTQARVWQCDVAKAGVSYQLARPDGVVVGVGALATDSFGQVWNVRYWLDPEHGHDSIARLSAART